MVPVVTLLVLGVWLAPAPQAPAAALPRPLPNTCLPISLATCRPIEELAARVAKVDHVG